MNQDELLAAGERWATTIHALPDWPDEAAIVAVRKRLSPEHEPMYQTTAVEFGVQVAIDPRWPIPSDQPPHAQPPYWYPEAVPIFERCREVIAANGPRPSQSIIVLGPLLFDPDKGWTRVL